MKNVYDIRNEKKMLYILDENRYFTPLYNSKSIAIVMNLYYADTVPDYMKYVNCISDKIDIYVISSQKDVFDQVNRLKKRDIFLICKENRGRDISALLVSFRQYYSKYEYICFLHDKKANHDCWEGDTKIWITDLWQNMINSNEYINEVLKLFQNNKNIGLLVPPEPVGEYFNAWYGDTWYGNFENVKKLAKDLNLQCDISIEKRCITLGTVFWVRTESLKKLFKRNWEYKDFPIEPMPLDGTLNHAIERVIGFVAQDAGYDVGTVMNKSYAEWLLLYAQDSMQAMYQKLDEKLGIQTRHQLDIYDEQEQMIEKFCANNSKVYIYGAGKYGKCILQIMKNIGYIPEGFVVGKGKRKLQKIDNINVFELDEIVNERELGIIISVDFNFQSEIEGNLKDKGITNYIIGVI